LPRVLRTPRVWLRRPTATDRGAWLDRASHARHFTTGSTLLARARRCITNHPDGSVRARTRRRKIRYCSSCRARSDAGRLVGYRSPVRDEQSRTVVLGWTRLCCSLSHQHSESKTLARVWCDRRNRTAEQILSRLLCRSTHRRTLVNTT